MWYILANIHVALGEHTSGLGTLFYSVLGTQNPWSGPLSNLTKGSQGTQNYLFATPSFPKHMHKTQLQLCIKLALEVVLSSQRVRLVDFSDYKNIPDFSNPEEPEEKESEGTAGYVTSSGSGSFCIPEALFQSEIQEWINSTERVIMFMETSEVQPMLFLVSRSSYC